MCVPLFIGVETLKAHVDDFIEVDVAKTTKDHKSSFRINLKVNNGPGQPLPLILLPFLFGSYPTPRNLIIT